MSVRCSVVKEAAIVAWWMYCIFCLQRKQDFWDGNVHIEGRKHYDDLPVLLESFTLELSYSVHQASPLNCLRSRIRTSSIFFVSRSSGSLVISSISPSSFPDNLAIMLSLKPSCCIFLSNSPSVM